MTSDLVICGRAFVDGELKYSEIGITDGMIDAVGKHTDGETKIDLGSSKTILPGFIDPHVHFRDPGMTQKEDFSTGSTAAVHGGVTAVLDMPNTRPPVTDLATLREKKRIVGSKAYCDYGLFAALSRGCPVDALAKHVCGFKLFMGSTTGNILLNDDDEISQLMAEIAHTGKTVSVHAEDDSLIDHDAGETCCQDHLRNRPAEAEYSALRRLSKFKENTINICHCTNVKQIEMAKGYGFNTEVALHHALFDARGNTDAFHKVNPPIRDPATRKELYEALLEGVPDMIGTDHAPHTRDEKEKDFDSAPSGMPGVETAVPMLMEMVVSEKMGMRTAVRMAAERPGGVFGLNKGRIKPGFDADFAVFDMRKVTEIDERELRCKAGWSPYRGMRAVFPDTVMVRGEIQVRDGELCGEPLGKDRFA